MSTPASAEWVLDADIGVAYDDNVNRAYASADIRADTSIAPSAAGGHVDVAWTVKLKQELKVRRAPGSEGRGRY